MKRILVVYFSRDGHTRRIAHEIAKACGAELEPIVEPTSRAGMVGYARSALEALLGVAPTLQPAARVPRSDDLVVIGTPIWFWNMASPVRSFVLAHRAQLGRVAFFCTCGGSGQEKVMHDLRALCGRAPVATLALTERQCARGGHQGELAAFVRELNKGRAMAYVPQTAPATAGRARGREWRGGRPALPTRHRIGQQHGHKLGAAEQLKGTP